MTWEDLSILDRAKILADNALNGNINYRKIVLEFNKDLGYSLWLKSYAKLRKISLDNVLTDPTYDYRAYYNSNPKEAWDVIRGEENAHLSDIGKTELHPTASDLSDVIADPNWMGRWDENNYYLSNNRSENPDLVDETLDYIGMEDPGVNVKYPNGANALPLLIVTPEEAYTPMRRNKYNNGWVYSDRPNEFDKGGKKKTKKSTGSKELFLKDYNLAWLNTRYNTEAWRTFWSKLAEVESSYSPNVENNIGARGYFLLMPFNRAAEWKDIVHQFSDVDKTMLSIEKQLTELDYTDAAKQGFSREAVLAGAWLGGVGGLRKTLKEPHKHKEILERMHIFNNLTYNTPTEVDWRTPMLVTLSYPRPYYTPDQSIVYALTNPVVLPELTVTGKKKPKLNIEFEPVSLIELMEFDTPAPLIETIPIIDTVDLLTLERNTAQEQQLYDELDRINILSNLPNSQFLYFFNDDERDKILKELQSNRPHVFDGTTESTLLMRIVPARPKPEELLIGRPNVALTDATYVAPKVDTDIVESNVDTMSRQAAYYRLKYGMDDSVSDLDAISNGKYLDNSTTTILLATPMTPEEVKLSKQRSEIINTYALNMKAGNKFFGLFGVEPMDINRAIFDPRYRHKAEAARGLGTMGTMFAIGAAPFAAAEAAPFIAPGTTGGNLLADLTLWELVNGMSEHATGKTFGLHGRDFISTHTPTLNELLYSTPLLSIPYEFATEAGLNPMSYRTVRNATKLIAGNASRAITNSIQKGKELAKSIANKLYRTPYFGMSLRSALKPFTHKYDKMFFNEAKSTMGREASKRRVKKVAEKELLTIRDIATDNFGNLHFQIKDPYIERPISGTFMDRKVEIPHYISTNTYIRMHGSPEKWDMSNNILQLPKAPTHINEGSMAQHLINKHLEKVRAKIGDDAVVGGSSITYGLGYASGIPNDIELVSTESRLENLLNKIGYSNVRRHPGKGYVVDGSSISYEGEPVDIQIILERNGHAAGLLAHEYYKFLFPEEYKRLVEEAVNSRFNKSIPTTLDTLELPISADDLYKLITPEILEKKVLQDMFLSDKDKHVLRSFLALTSENPYIRPEARKAMKQAIHTHFDEYELASEYYPNLKFDNIEENKKFLTELNLPLQFAENEEIMRNIVDRWHLANTTLSRTVFARKGSNIYIPDRETLNRAINTTYAPYNSNWSGIGGNTVAYIGRGGIGGDFTGVMLLRLTFYPETITSPMDLLNKAKKLHDFRNYDPKLYAEFDNIENTMRSRDLPEALGIQDLYSLAYKSDTPMYIGDEYGEGVYLGNIVSPMLYRIYPVTGDYMSIAPEIGGRGIPNPHNTPTTYMNEDKLSIEDLLLIDKAKELYRKSIYSEAERDAKEMRINKLNRKWNKLLEMRHIASRVVPVVGGGLGTVGLLVAKENKRLKSELNRLYTILLKLSSRGTLTPLDLYFLSNFINTENTTSLLQLEELNSILSKYKYGGKLNKYAEGSELNVLQDYSMLDEAKLSDGMIKYLS